MPKIELGFNKEINWESVNQSLPKTIDETIDFSSMTDKQRFIFSNKYLIIECIGFLAFLLPGIALYAYRSSQWKKFTSNITLDWTKLVTDSFSTFDNIQIDKKVDEVLKKREIIKAFRPTGIASDAHYQNAITLLAGTVDNLKFSIFFVTWRAQRTTYTNGRVNTYYVYFHRFIIISNDINQAYKGFNFQLIPNTISTKRSNFENDKFNKLFTTNFNDEVKARTLLTPAVQEGLVLAANRAKQINLVLADGLMIQSVELSSNIAKNLDAIVSARPREEKKLEQILVDNIMKDLKNVATAISIANIFRNLQTIFK